MPAERTVRRLKLRAPDAALARCAQFLLEDALRTASLPGEGAAVVLVRRVRLPAFRATTTPQAVAVALEAKCRQLAPLRVDEGTAEAELEAADAVRFDDPAHACRELAVRVLRGERPRAWCWALALKGYRPGMDSGDALRTMLMTLAVREEAPAAVPPWCEAVVAGGGAPRMLAALTTDDAAVLLRVLPPGATLDGGKPLAPPGRAFGAADPARATAQSWGEALAWAAGAFAAQDDRLRWFAALACACAGALLGPVAGRRGKAAAGAATAQERARAELRPGAGAEEGSMPASQAGAQAESGPAGAAGRGPEAQSGRPRRRRRTRSASRETDTRRSAVARDAAPAGQGAAQARVRARPAAAPAGSTDRAAPPPTARGRAADRRAADGTPDARVPFAVALQATRAGGLLFLLPLLETLQFPAWLATRPEGERARLAARLLGAALDRLRLPADDPMRCLTAAAIEGGAPSQPVTRLRAARHGRSRAAVSDAAADAELSAWLMRCRRWLRGAAGIGLASLVLRRALVRITPTHVDVWLAPDTADIRIRRAGLDVDPGWVPWLGRVVQFHYGDVGQ